ncbi:hypothetical protein MTO96_027221 [Rhipicephalus appendiculatus]
MGPGGAAGGPGTQSYPVHPDVRFKRLPFYDILAELHRPASLMPNSNSRFQENSFVFHFTPQQVHDIVSSRDYNLGSKPEFTVQVQLRFCLLETSCEQDDNYPPSMCVKVNSKVCPLPSPIPTNKPGMEPKRPSRPINIVSMCRLSPTVSNHISVTWLSEYGRAYALGVYLVRKLTATTLLQRLKATGMRNPDHTRAMIKEKLQHDPDSEIATTSLRGSLICPLGKMRMGIPCRALTCPHLQCFDASLYLQMNEKKPTWICPVCDRPATFSSLVIDGLFMEISMKAPSDCTEVQFHEDGSWSPLVPKKETHVINSPSSSATASTSRSSAPSSSSREPAGRPNKKPRVVVIDLTACSSDEDDDGGRSSVPTPGSHLGVPPPLVSGMPSGGHSQGGPPINSTRWCPVPTSWVFPTVVFVGCGLVGTASHESSSSGMPPSTLASGSLYPGMPVMDAGTPPYYPPVSSPYQEYFSPAHPMYHYNFDLYSLLNSDTERSDLLTRPAPLQT